MRARVEEKEEEKEKEKEEEEEVGKSVDEDDGAPRKSRRYWLMKAEPETRIVKGVDVKFSIDDLMECREPAAWDGGSG